MPLKDPQKRKRYEKKYAQTHKEKRQEINKRWNEKHKDKVLEVAKRHRDKHPEQVHAVAVAQNIQKARSCLRCGSTEYLHKHHPDYSKPREIITLCAKCHNRLHRLLGPTFTEAQASNMIFPEGFL